MLTTPDHLHTILPITKAANHTVVNTRNTLKHILQGNDRRLVVIVGPCSIHDTDSAYEYALKLQDQINQYQDTLCIIMRTYFEKPRTQAGWKGLISDPDLNGQCDMQKGLSQAI